MYSYIKGELAELKDNTIVVECNGIGYNITVPLPALDTFFEIGQEVKIYTYLQVREDAMKLFGFLSRQDKEIFEMLISVSGIGPKGAISILSTMTTDELRYAVLGQDDKAIAKAPGIGGKTAQRLIVDLKDKFTLEDAFDSKTEQIASANTVNNNTALGAAAETKNNVIEALLALGFSQSEVLRACRNLNYNAGYSEEELIKMAFGYLA